MTNYQPLVLFLFLLLVHFRMAAMHSSIIADVENLRAQTHSLAQTSQQEAQRASSERMLPPTEQTSQESGHIIVELLREKERLKKEEERLKNRVQELENTFNRQLEAGAQRVQGLEATIALNASQLETITKQLEETTKTLAVIEENFRLIHTAVAQRMYGNHPNHAISVLKKLGLGAVLVCTHVVAFLLARSLYKRSPEELVRYIDHVRPTAAQAAAPIMILQEAGHIGMWFLHLMSLRSLRFLATWHMGGVPTRMLIVYRLDQ